LTSSSRTILFAGGGTLGHVFPSIAVWQCLQELDRSCTAHFLVSNRPVDRQVLAKQDLPHTCLSATPLRLTRPWTWPKFAAACAKDGRTCRNIIRRSNVGAVVATGGFVAAPAIWAAGKMGVPIAMMSLDAVAGKANRHLASRATALFSVYPDPRWPQATLIGLPLPREAIGPDDPAAARRQLDLDPQRDTLLVTGGSLGAQTINQMMIGLLGTVPVRKALADWQVLHLAGPAAAGKPILAELRTAYQKAKVAARIETFCNAMGLAWSAASLAVARAGANTVAEVWANCTPTIFLPYPYHRDQHQRRNAEPLADLDGAVLSRDLIDPQANTKQLTGPLSALLSNPAQRQHMARRLRETRPANGAQIIARWVRSTLG